MIGRLRIVFGKSGGRRWNRSEKMKGELDLLQLGLTVQKVKQSDLRLERSHKKRRVGCRSESCCKSKALGFHGLFSSC